MIQFKINKYELCEHVVVMENDAEKIIGMVRYFGNCFDAFVNELGQISKGGFEVFDDKQIAINCIIESYRKLMMK